MIVAFGDDRKRHVVVDPDLRMLRDHRVDHAVIGTPDVERIGKHDRRFEPPGFVDPVRPRHLAVAVENERAGRRTILPRVGVRNDRRRTGTNRPAAGNECT